MSAQFALLGQVDMILSNNAERVSGCVEKEKNRCSTNDLRFQQLFVSGSFYSISRVLGTPTHVHTHMLRHSRSQETGLCSISQELSRALLSLHAAQSSCLALSPSLTQGE